MGGKKGGGTKLQRAAERPRRSRSREKASVKRSRQMGQHEERSREAKKVWSGKGRIVGGVTGGRKFCVKILKRKFFERYCHFQIQRKKGERFGKSVRKLQGELLVITNRRFFGGR